MLQTKKHKDRDIGGTSRKSRIVPIGKPGKRQRRKRGDKLEALVDKHELIHTYKQTYT